jgi:hypothetical protein
MPLPQLRISNLRKAFDNGEHNAFTDLCLFGGRIYLTFRSCPDGHMVFSSSRIMTLSSVNGQEWEQAFEFSVPGRDTRDPHFLVFGDRLYVYTGCWQVPPEGVPRSLNNHLGYGAWTTDGVKWEGPVPLEGTYGHYVWRAASLGGSAFICARRRRQFASPHEGESRPELIEAAFLTSQDGLIWSFGGLFTKSYGDETAFLFEDDGSILALVRGSRGRPARICRSSPPYREWRRRDLDRNVGGPMLVKWGDNYLAGGRNTTDPQRPRTTLYWLVNDALHEAAEMPSGGDNSYPAFVALDAEHGLLSYYSSHETDGPDSSAVYLADLSLA